MIPFSKRSDFLTLAGGGDMYGPVLRSCTVLYMKVSRLCSSYISPDASNCICSRRVDATENGLSQLSAGDL